MIFNSFLRIFICSWTKETVLFSMAYWRVDIFLYLIINSQLCLSFKFRNQSMVVLCFAIDFVLGSQLILSRIILFILPSSISVEFMSACQIRWEVFFVVF